MFSARIIQPASKTPCEQSFSAWAMLTECRQKSLFFLILPGGITSWPPQQMGYFPLESVEIITDIAYVV
jgi:hypothetical protein